MSAYKFIFQERVEEDKVIKKERGNKVWKKVERKKKEKKNWKEWMKERIKKKEDRNRSLFRGRKIP